MRLITDPRKRMGGERRRGDGKGRKKNVSERKEPRRELITAVQTVRTRSSSWRKRSRYPPFKHEFVMCARSLYARNCLLDESNRASAFPLSQAVLAVNNVFVCAHRGLSNYHK